MADEKKKQLVTAEEENSISRRMMAWINSYPDLPANVSRVDFEQLPADKPGMSLSVVQGAFITRKYISGGHEAEYQFSVFYRIKPGTSNDARLKADETLNAFSDWATFNPPNLGNNIRVKAVEALNRAALLVAYENGDEDHNILMKLTYEVI